MIIGSESVCHGHGQVEARQTSDFSLSNVAGRRDEDELITDVKHIAGRPSSNLSNALLPDADRETSKRGTGEREVEGNGYTLAGE